ncbi:electron-transferring flavoprotein small chain [Halanaerobium saccharolyticum subsp. saccharolyticum DSM 6643]|uniref:Electron transfer flavoprotein small subunit n=1 Tax=Halanaerobium saccharolyticum subsp. saccharolyticum DSM 6643 TaxID=1293054 RepID=M5E0C6_9FIRM|nr:electron transfer flavoprotein subunit beta/FixA family protein [Halanaerobium saccharolyticum]CCU78899.1 electron-transferring flavoprotein small chain [Halanaerobium saccharolyticum subsp. saccharolyticum DSM 6643]
MEILVCVKQVPETKDVEVDENGNLIRDGVDSIMNPHDMYALETALRLKAEHGGTVSAITMGPPQSKEVIREAYMMGADKGYILSDIKFAGADVLATSYTLSQGLEVIGLKNGYDLIICGMESTDGDTAQVGPAIAETLKIPHVAYVSSIKESNGEKIIVEKDMGETIEIVEFSYPGLITVTKEVNQPRLPSYRLKLDTRDRKIETLTFADLLDDDENNFGLKGSPTQVEKVFPPDDNIEKVMWTGNGEELSEKLFNELKELKVI